MIAADFEGHRIAVTAWPAGLALALGLTLPVLALWQRRRAPGADLARIGLLSMAGLLAALFRAWPPPTAPSSAASVFPALATADAVALGLGLAGLGLGALDLLRGRGAGALAGVLLGLGGASAFLAGAHGAWLALTGPLPGLSLARCAVVHEGLDCTPALGARQLGRVAHSGLLGLHTAPIPMDLGGWTVEAPAPATEGRGTWQRTLVVRRPGIAVSTPATVRVAEDRTGPLLAPAPGRRWRFLLAAGRGGVLPAELVAPDPAAAGPIVALRVDGEVVAEGLHRHRLVLEVEGQAPRAVDLVGLDGESFVLDEEGRPEALVRLGEAWVPPPGAPPLPPLRRCTVDLLPQPHCYCVEAGLDAARPLPGPVFCQEADVVDAVAAVVVAVATLGTAIQPPATQDLLLLQAGP